MNQLNALSNRVEYYGPDVNEYYVFFTEPVRRQSNVFPDDGRKRFTLSERR